ncbi:glutaredoxin-dependent arsenate reductase [Corynebacterium kutscheri]|uniref:Glutaredoxin-dependent arsenate reductase n=1 Tax=Corynebacterium kutscheri TaxID=35755 RepID=A0A0F6TDL9_9CORY|nr:arsenate reductase (glutaredoxin) [Corynebacterium kutscheri]AKE41731.1 glutaredoxin-dependent arsenate reductase [Corynebacterium kutscheri]VEH10058.1 arsenate reductase [Corynebacterium kutscheri]
MDVTIFHNPRCSKSRAALDYLKDHDITPLVVSYLTDTPDVATLADLFQRMGITPFQALRSNETKAKELNLDETSSDSEILHAMVAHPQLIERPIVVTARGVVIARPTEKIEEIL